MGGGKKRVGEMVKTVDVREMAKIVLTAVFNPIQEIQVLPIETPPSPQALPILSRRDSAISPSTKSRWSSGGVEMYNRCIRGPERDSGSMGGTRGITEGMATISRMTVMLMTRGPIGIQRPSRSGGREAKRSCRYEHRGHRSKRDRIPISEPKLESPFSEKSKTNSNEP